MGEKRSRSKVDDEEEAGLPPSKSILSQSAEMSFPRGGESVLSPMEIKTITGQAKSDALFEEKSRVLSSKKSKKSSTSSEVVTKRVGKLSFNALQPGSLVLGQIIGIKETEIVLSLAGNLTGYIPITNISKELTKRLEDLDSESDSDSSSDEDSKVTVGSYKNKGSEIQKLDSMFTVGQYLRAVVTDNTSSSGRKSIELSIEPEKVNENLTKQDLVDGTLVQVAVKSVEDHGLILDVGLRKLRGFLPKKALKSNSLNVVPGSVLLLSIDGIRGRTITFKLPTKKEEPTTSVSTVDAILPGTLVEATISELGDDGLFVQLFDLQEGSINLAHLSIYDSAKLEGKFHIGTTIKARVYASYIQDGKRTVLLSNLRHILDLSMPYNTEKQSAPLEAFPIGHVFDDVVVKGLDSQYIFIDLGAKSLIGEVHKSRVTAGSDLEKDFAIGSHHRARVLGYSSFDNVYILTMDAKIIDKKYLRMQDIPVGTLVGCEIEKIVPGKGISVKVEGVFNGFIPDAFLSDFSLQNPDRKFKIGKTVKGRVLRVAYQNSRPVVYVTVKKSLVGVDTSMILSTWEGAEINKKFPGTVERLYPGGCLVGFFGHIRGFLPNSEMSETFVSDPSNIVRIGQTVTVRIVSVDKNNNRMKLSLRTSSVLSETQEKAMDKLVAGRTIVDAKVVDKQKDVAIVELSDSKLRGILPAGQLTDSTYEKSRSALKHLKVGSHLKVLVLEKVPKERYVKVSSKQSLIKDSQSGKLPVAYEDISISSNVLHGFVKNISKYGLFVSFGNDLTGLILPSYLDKSYTTHPERLFFKDQTINCHVARTDDRREKFLLALDDNEIPVVRNPVDSSIKKITDYKPGKPTKGVIKSIKSAQLTIKLADNVIGRVGIANIFDSYDEIKDVKAPLEQFDVGKEVELNVIGYYDPKKHVTSEDIPSNFRNIAIDLSIKKHPVDGKSLKSGDKVIGFVSNYGDGYLWVSVASNTQGEVATVDLSDDLAELADVEEHFPVSSALKLTVLPSTEKLSNLRLSARSHPIVSFDSVKAGDLIPGRIVKVDKTFVLVQIGEDVDAIVYITDALDDYSKSLEDVFAVDRILPVKILEADKPNQRIYGSLRTGDASSKGIESIDDLKVGQVVKGFIKHVANNGVFVALSRDIYALVRVTDLSDSYLKDWKQFYTVHQPVVGKIIRCDGPGKILMTLKESEVNTDGNLLKRFADIKVGDIYNGVVKSTTDFGVFVKLDGTVNLTGLCYKTEIADQPVDNFQSLFNDGDKVKVKVLRTNPTKKQLSLGMKASYFTSGNEDSDVEMESEDEEEASSDAESSSDSDEDVMNDESESNSSEDEEADTVKPSEGLSIKEGLSTGVDWTASILEQADESSSDSEDEYDENLRKKKKKSKRTKLSELEDKTAEINSRAPESVSDFERLLLGNPNSSILWMKYMSFQLQLGEVDKARAIGKRALKTINYREEKEKLNIWIALLNLETMFGTEESLEKVFKDACQYMDSYLIHQKMVAIFASSEKFDEADKLFKETCKKFGSDHAQIWVSYGSFLIDRNRADECHQLLVKALQVLPKRNHIEAVRKFAQLEFAKGDAEQGRSLFEGLLADVPKRLDLLNVYIDQEIKHGDNKKVEDLFERATSKKLTKRQAKFFFGKWLAHEEKQSDTKASDYVKAKAAEYAEKLAEKEEDN